MYKRDVQIRAQKEENQKINQAGSKVEASCKRSQQGVLMGLNQVLKEAGESICKKSCCRLLQEDENLIHRRTEIEGKQHV